MRKQSKIFILLLAVVLVVGVVFVFWGMQKQDFRFQGKLVEKERELPVEIQVSRSNFDTLFHRLSGEVKVYGDSLHYTYSLIGKTLLMENGYYAVLVDRFSSIDNGAHGFILFDADLQNLVIDTDVEKVYAADGKLIAAAESLGG